MSDENTAERPEDAALRFAGRLGEITKQIDRYFVAAYGEGYRYQAPEKFDNVLERWMLYILRGDLNEADNAMWMIEKMAARSKKERGK